MSKFKIFGPGKSCVDYMFKNSEEALTLITKKEFDILAREKKFIDGPYKDTFGDDYGTPYNTNRQAFGRTKDNGVVYCELSKERDDKVKKSQQINKAIKVAEESGAYEIAEHHTGELLGSLLERKINKK